MCAIISWAGMLPKGLLTNLLLQSERRGHDSTGLAFRLKDSNVSFRQAISASEFVNNPENRAIMSDARRSVVGIAHTRRASPGMPINNQNAHPFLYWRYFFVHNGVVQNWKELRDDLIRQFVAAAASAEAKGDAAAVASAKWCITYCESAKTDSMILGPYIHSEDFSCVVGCMALAWLRDSTAYVSRMAKEAVSTTLLWRYTEPPEGEDADDRIVTIVGSTEDIITDSLAKLKGVEFDHSSFTTFPEGVIYKVTPTGLAEVKRLSTFKAVQDQFTSEETPTTAPVNEQVNGTTMQEPPTPLDSHAA